MANEALKQFAEDLKRAKEEKELTLQQIFSKTRIDQKFLRAVEEGNFEIMPQVYVRAFIKEYANAVGLNGEEELRKYDDIRLGKSSSGEEEQSTSEEKREEFYSEPKTRGKKVVTFEDNTAPIEVSKKNPQGVIIGSILGVFAIVILIGLYYYLFEAKANDIVIEKPYQPDTSERYKETVVGEKYVEKEETVDSTEESSDVPSSKTYSGELKLELSAHATTWIRMKIDDVKNQEFTLTPNTILSFKGEKKFEILIGNAGGLELKLNGEKLNFKGKPGEIKKIMVDSKGIHYLGMQKASDG